MTSTRALAILALVAPLTAAAQVSYSQAVITGDAPHYRYGYRTACDDRNDALWERKARLDAEQRDVDRDGANLEAMKSRLDDEYRYLDWANSAAIAEYNAQSREYNRLIQAHNRNVARMNGAADVLNNDSQALVQRCGGAIISSR